MAQRPRVIFPRRGELYLVSFDPSVGAEIRKTRPALVIQNDIGNRFSPTVIVAAATSEFEGEPYPTDVIVRAPEGGLERDSAILLSQIRTIDKRRLFRRLGMLKTETVSRTDRALVVSLGLVEV